MTMDRGLISKCRYRPYDFGTIIGSIGRLSVVRLFVSAISGIVLVTLDSKISVSYRTIFQTIVET